MSNKDLIADILPPPLYVVEFSLLLNQAYFCDDIQDIDKLILKTESLKNDFNVRYNYWKDSVKLDQDQYVFIDSIKFVTHSLFQKAETDYFKLLKQSNKVKAEDILLKELTPLYDRSRYFVDLLVKITTDKINNTSNETNELVNNILIKLTISIILILIMMILIVRYISNLIVKPLEKLNYFTMELSKGNLDVDI